MVKFVSKALQAARIFLPEDKYALFLKEVYNTKLVQKAQDPLSFDIQYPHPLHFFIEWRAPLPPPIGRWTSGVRHVYRIEL